jgi:hypothetical protein
MRVVWRMLRRWEIGGTSGSARRVRRMGNDGMVGVWLWLIRKQLRVKERTCGRGELEVDRRGYFRT